MWTRADLGGGVLAGYATYREMFQPFVRCVAYLGFYRQRILAPADDALAALKEHCPTFADSDLLETRNRAIDPITKEVHNSVGVHVRPEVLMKLVYDYPSFARTLWGKVRLPVPIFRVKWSFPPFLVGA